MTVTLYNNNEQREVLKAIRLKISVPVSSSLAEESCSHSVVTHDCDDASNKVVLVDLIKYSEEIADHWQEIALNLNIPNKKVKAINIDHPHVRKRCNAMFAAWLELQRTRPCWCYFVQALCNVGLHGIEGEVERVHLKLPESKKASSGINSGITETQPHLKYASDISNTIACHL